MPAAADLPRPVGIDPAVFDDPEGVPIAAPAHQSAASAIVGAQSLQAVGITEPLFDALIAARLRTGLDGGTWRVACAPALIETLGRSLVRGTAVAELIRADALSLRIDPASMTTSSAVENSPAARPRTRLVSDDAAFLLAGPTGEQILLETRAPTTLAGITDVVTDRLADTPPATVRMPSRARLVHAAHQTLGSRFTRDLATMLAGARPDDLNRSGLVSDRILLLALGARHDQLATDLLGWADALDIAARETFTDPCRTLVDAGLIETIKVPMGVGHPHRRLRALDDALLNGPIDEIPAVLRTRLQTSCRGTCANRG